MPSFGAQSLHELSTCDPRLQDVFNQVIKFWDCQIIQGKRTEAEALSTQEAGTSHTKTSKHVYPLESPSLAVDVAPYPVDWKDRERFYAFGGFVIGVAFMLGVRLRWGGDWDSDRDLHDQSFTDLPHFELVDV